MKITWQDLEGVIKRSGKRERERERVAVLTAGHKFNVNPGRYRFLLSSVRGWGLDRPPPGFFFFFYDRVQPPDKKPGCKEFPWK